MPNPVKIEISAVTGAAESILENFRKKTEEGFLELGKTLAAAFAVEKILEFVKHTIEGAVEMERFSEKTGVAVEKLSALSIIAEKNGISQPEFQNALRSLATHLQALAHGDEDAQKLFRGMGIYQTTFKSLDEALYTIANRFEAMGPSAKRSADATALFGRTGENLIPALKDGAAGLDRQIAALVEMGVVLDGPTAKAALEFEHAIFDIKLNVEAFANGLLKQLLPALKDMADKIKGVADGSHAANPVLQAIGAVLKALSTAVAFAYYYFSALAEFLNASFVSVVIIASGAIGTMADELNILGDTLRKVKDFYVDLAKGVLNFTLAQNSLLTLHPARAAEEARQALKSFGEAGHDAFGVLQHAIGDTWQNIKNHGTESAKDLRVTWTDAIAAIGGKMAGFVSVWKKIWNPKAHLGEEGAEPEKKKEDPSDPQKDIAISLKRVAALDEEYKLRQKMAEFASSDPYRTDMEKAATLIPMLQQQNLLLDLEYAETKKIYDMAGPGDKQKLDAEKKLNELQLEHISNLRKIDALDTGFLTTMRKGLVQLTSAWGDFGHTMANGVLDSIKNGVSGIGQAIVDVIAGTKTWGQVFAQIGRNIIATILQVVVQWIVSMTIIAALKKLFGTQDNAQASASASAWAPAAIAASIASYGTAAGIGLAGFVAALGTGTALAGALSAGGGAFAEGGVTPGSTSMIQVGERGPEYVIKAEALRQHGRAIFDRLNAGMSAPGGSSSAGPSAGGSPVHVAILNDHSEFKQFMESHLGEEIVTRHIAKNKNKLGLR